MCPPPLGLAAHSGRHNLHICQDLCLLSDTRTLIHTWTLCNSSQEQPNFRCRCWLNKFQPLSAHPVAPCELTNRCRHAAGCRTYSGFRILNSRFSTRGKICEFAYLCQMVGLTGSIHECGPCLRVLVLLLCLVGVVILRPSLLPTGINTCRY